jgi:hypothetical protein
LAGKLKSAERRLKFTFDFPAVNESLWLGRRLWLRVEFYLFRHQHVLFDITLLSLLLLFLSHLLFYMQTVLYALKIETRDIFKGTEKCMWNKTSRCCCEKACFPLQYAIGVDYLFAAI